MVLDGHKRIGKRFIPPLLAREGLEFVHWLDEILPELLWLGMLRHDSGDAATADAAVSLAVVAKSTHRRHATKWFAPASAFNALSPANWARVHASIANTPQRDVLVRAIAPIARLYPSCPLAPLLRDDEIAGVGEERAKQVVRATIEELVSRRDTPATMVQGHAIYIAFVCDILTVSPGLALANFPELQNYPQGDESKRVGSAVRAAVSAMIGLGDAARPSRWARDFWNRGLALEECSYDRS